MVFDAACSLNSIRCLEIEATSRKFNAPVLIEDAPLLLSVKRWITFKKVVRVCQQTPLTRLFFILFDIRRRKGCCSLTCVDE